MTRTATLAIEGGTPVRNTFLPFGAPVIGTAEIEAVVATLRSGWIGTGPRTEAFERAFAEYVGAPHAVGVNSCTAALHLSLIVAGISAGDEVITTPLTFAATANAILHAGATPRFVDIDPKTLNIDVARIAEAITPRTKAIVPVHFGGLACDLAEILQLAAAHDLVVIEDAAHAVGTRYQGRMIGAVGALTCFSFYPNKNMTTIEGGMVTTARDDWAERLKVYRLHGLGRHAWQRYQARHLVLSDAIAAGFKYNLTDVQSALGLVQLRQLEAFQEKRTSIARAYDTAFALLDGVRTQPRPDGPNDRHALHLYVLLLDPKRFRCDRNQIIDGLLAENVGAALHYRALHTHPLYQKTLGHRPDDFPHAYRVGQTILALPISPAMGPQDVDDVIEAVHKVLAAYRR